MNTLLLLKKLYATMPREVFPTAVSWDDGEFISSVTQKYKPRSVIEVGLGFGLAALWIEHGPFRPKKHIIVEKYPTAFHSYGFKVLSKFKHKNISLIESSSQEYLASLMKRNDIVDLVFLDADQRFDALVSDMHFITKLLWRDGIIVSRNMWNPSVRRALWFYFKNLPYSLVGCTKWENVLIKKLPFVMGSFLFRVVCKFRLHNYCVMQKNGKDTREWNHYIHF